MKRLILFVLLVILLASCTSEEATTVTAKELNSDPDNWEGRKVSITGHVVEYMGEDTSFLLLPYTHMYPCQRDADADMEICTEIRLSVSQVRVGKFRFSDGEDTIVVSQRKGGMYLPIPFVFASEPKLPEGELKVTGKWVKEKGGDYNLYISGEDEIKE